ncbi:MAG: S9 family peptidase [Candidatus Eisenbacteria bacterium]|uniref:S9 family peptidase n=1 Tax=Eiseniibacteriota bacterium TaxID=2212470 RepID=A0A7Y2EB59_UNCEI|nr:S9 family peptidase [Candidatus Eisenbacteria bacterium]
MRSVIRFGLVVVALALTAGTSLAVKPPMTSMDLLSYQWVGDPQVSPDGQFVAFTRVVPDSASNQYQSSLYLVRTEGGRPFRITQGTMDTTPRWSPDSQSLCFLRKGADTESRQLWILPLVGGEARQITNHAPGVGAAWWSPKGTHIVFEATALTEDPPRSLSPDIPWNSDAAVVTEPYFRDAGGNILDKNNPTHLWITTPNENGVEQLTEVEQDHAMLSWSPDGSTVFYTRDDREDPWFRLDDQNMFAMNHLQRKEVRVIDIDGPLYAGTVNKKGKWALWGRKNPEQDKTYLQDEILIAGPVRKDAPLRNHDAQVLTDGYDHDIGNYIGTDGGTPVGQGGWRPLWSADEKAVFAVVSERGKSNLARIEYPEGRVKWITPGKNCVFSFSADKERKKFAVLMGDSKRPADIWLLDGHGKGLKRLTNFNDAFLSTRHISGAEEITFESIDGALIQAWLYKPRDYVPWKKYPLVVQIHGGPHIAYGESYFHEFQTLASRGYVVLAVNPRGSATFGDEFASAIQYEYPGNDIHDILYGVDFVLDLGFVNPSRMGVTGGSGGGYLTNWIIVKDHRFKAAATQRCVSDWLSFYATTDFTMYTPFWFKKQPWEDPMEYIKRSPAYHAASIRTPLLIIHSESDQRTPINQAETMFRALKGLKKETVMVRFPNEQHGLSRNGSPKRRVERNEVIANWFDSKLQGTGFSADAP